MSERVLELIARHQAEGDALRAKELRALQRCEQRLSFLQNAKGVLLAHARYDLSAGGDPVAIHHGIANTLFEAEAMLRCSVHDVHAAERMTILVEAERSWRRAGEVERAGFMTTSGKGFMTSVSRLHAANPTPRPPRHQQQHTPMPIMPSPSLSTSRPREHRRVQLLQRLGEELNQWEMHARAEIERCECVAFRNAMQQERTGHIVCSVWQGGVSPYLQGSQSGRGGSRSPSGASPWSFYPTGVTSQGPLVVAAPRLPTQSRSPPKRLSFYDF